MPKLLTVVKVQDPSSMKTVTKQIISIIWKNLETETMADIIESSILAVADCLNEVSMIIFNE